MHGTYMNIQTHSKAVESGHVRVNKPVLQIRNVYDILRNDAPLKALFMLALLLCQFRP